MISRMLSQSSDLGDMTSFVVVELLDNYGTNTARVKAQYQGLYYGTDGPKMAPRSYEISPVSISLNSPPSLEDAAFFI